MNNLNSVLIEGELKTDVAVDTSEPKVVMFTIASKQSYKSNEGNAEEVNYLDIEATGKLAKYCLDKAHQGRWVRVVGRLKQERWNDAEGKEHSKVSIVAEHVEFRPER